MAKSIAQLRGRDYVVPGDVKEVFIPTLAHRMILTGRAESQGKTAEQILKAVLDGTPAPRLRSCGGWRIWPRWWAAAFAI